MKVSQLIRQLKELKEIHGDLPVVYAWSDLDEPAYMVDYVHEPLTHERYFRIS